jgi:hypothetical protein
MTAHPQFEPGPQEAPDAFYSGALDRIRNSMIVLAFVLTEAEGW